MQPTPSEVIKEFRNRPPGSLPPLQAQVPEQYTKLREKLPARSFCSVWLRGALGVVFFQGYRQPIMNNCKLAAALVCMQLVVGIFQIAAAFYTRGYCPSLKVRDVPTWAGIPLAITGFFGTLFVSCCHREYPGNFGVFAMKTFSFVFSAINVVLCVCSVSFIGVHLVTMTTFTDCTSSADAVGPELRCVCRVDLEPRDRLYSYERISCEDLFTELRIYFVIMGVLSCLGALASFAFTVLLWGSRYEHFYAGLRPNEDAPLPIFLK